MNVSKLFPSPASFRIALIIYVVAPLIVALGFSGYLALNSFERQVEVQMQNDLELVARAVQLPLSYALEKERMGSMMQALESVFSIGRVYSAYIYDGEGREIATLGLADPEPKPDRLTKLAADGEKRGEYGSIAGKEVYSFFVPLTGTGGQINGLLHLTRRGSEFNDDLRSIRIKGVLGLALLLGLLSAIVLYGHHRALGMHLARMSSSMSRVAEGDREHRFDEEGPKEIVELGESYNHMLASIDAAEKALVEHRRKQEELEGELRQSEKLAAIGRLGAGTAHELGTPLSVISGKAQRALRDPDLSGRQRETLESIREEVTRMEYIITQLLDFSRRGKSRFLPTAPASLAASAVSAVEENARENGTTIKVTGFEETFMWMDTMRVQQALVNLLSNAVYSAFRGNVHFSWERRDDGVHFCVEDDGAGVPKEIRAKIFEPFYTTKPVGKGTGLGLAVVHAVAEEHGGSIKVGEGKMGGACFDLRIPEQKQGDGPDGLAGSLGASGTEC